MNRKGSGNPARGRSAGKENAAARVALAHDQLERLEQDAPPFSIVYFGVEPQWVTDDLDQPLSGSTYLHGEDQISGRMLHLPSTHRGATMAEASRDFTLPFIAVPRREVLPLDSDMHAVVVAGADWTARPIMDGLRIIQMVRRMPRLHFSAMVGLDAAEGEYAPADPEELSDLVSYLSARLQLEVVIASEPYRALALSMDRDGWLAAELAD